MERINWMERGVCGVFSGTNVFLSGLRQPDLFRDLYKYEKICGKLLWFRKRISSFNSRCLGWNKQLGCEMDVALFYSYLCVKDRKKCFKGELMCCNSMPAKVSHILPNTHTHTHTLDNLEVQTCAVLLLPSCYTYQPLWRYILFKDMGKISIAAKWQLFIHSIKYGIPLSFNAEKVGSRCVHEI